MIRRLIVVWLALGCEPRLREIAGPDAAPAPVDGAPFFTPPAGGQADDGCQARACGSIEPLCPDGMRCVAGLCRPDRGACLDDGDCLNDTACRNKACVPFGETCQREPVSASACLPAAPLPAPHVVCNWTGGQAMSTPMVADLDHDGKPEVVLAISNILFDYAFENRDRVVALHADTCQPIWDVAVPVWSELAVADLDGDGLAEIVFASSPPYDAKDTDQSETITVLDHRGQVRASYHGRRAALRWQAAPLIVDLDGVAPPEIVYRDTALRFRPAAGGKGTLEVVWRAEPRSPGERWLSAPTAADLDGDGLPEILDGDQILDGATGRDETPPALLPDKIASYAADYAIPQVGDFNGDGSPDLIHVSPQGVSIYDFRARRILWSTRLPSEGPGAAPIGGPAVVADLDGDGTPDFAFATRAQLLAYALKCVPSDRPADCQGEPGVLWAQRIQDPSSGIASAAAFDFNADGVVEIVYRDENWLRVFAGPTGRTLFRLPVSSGTALEEPVVADATGDGHADILVMSNLPGELLPRPREPETGAMPQMTKGLFVLSDESYAAARPLWNQHAYQPGLIGDDLTVPARPASPWRAGTRQQTLPPAVNKPRPAPDLTARIDLPVCGDRLGLRGAICNRGPVAIAAGVQATFYDGPPDGGGRALCTTTPAPAMDAGQCQNVGCASAAAPPDLYLRAGDDGHGGRARPQCTLDNDLAVRRGTTCTSVVP
jgi:hypothetical protein